VQIPKAQKDSQVVSVFLHLWDLCAKKWSQNGHKMIMLLGSTGAKAAHRTLMKLIPGVNFIILCSPFTLVDPKSAKRQSSCHCLFCASGICGRNSCS